MSAETADVNLVLAVILPNDALRGRAIKHLRRSGRLVVPMSAGIELMLICKRFAMGYVETLGATERHFDLEGRDVLYTAAQALDAGEVATVLDAVHLADALHRGGRLHTADAALHETAFPTEAF